MEHEPQINKKVESDSIEKNESPSFVDEFWERHGRPKDNFWDNKDGNSEFVLSVWLEEDLRRAIKDLGWKLFLDVNTPGPRPYIICPDNKNQFKVLFTFSDNPEVSISLVERDSPKLLEEFGEVSSPEQGSIIESIDEKLKALGIHAKIPRITREALSPGPESPDMPPGLPPTAEKVSQEDVQSMNPIGVISHGLTRALQHALLWPEIGSEGHSTKYGIINGPLIYSDGLIAIFETPYGLIKIPFDELLGPSGISYGDHKVKIKKRLKERARIINEENNESQQQQEMHF